MFNRQVIADFHYATFYEGLIGKNYAFGAKKKKEKKKKREAGKQGKTCFSFCVENVAL